MKDKSKLFNLLRQEAHNYDLNRGLSVVHSKIIKRVKAWELDQFEKKMKHIDLGGNIPVNQYGRTVSFI